MEDSKISVIIAAYNTEEYIFESIDSVLNQTYKNMDIIIVDDGSVDNAASNIDFLTLINSNMVCIHQANKGILSSRINGVYLSDGDYIGFVDSDDYVEPYMYDSLLRNIKEYNADISHCGYKMINGNIISEYYGTKKIKTQNNNEGIKDLLEGRIIEPTCCTKLYRKKLFDGLSFDRKINNAEDLLLNFNMFLKSSKSIYEDITPYHYIRRNDSYCKSTDMNEQESDLLFVYDFMKELSKDKPIVNRHVLNKEAQFWIQKYNSSIRKSDEVSQEIVDNIKNNIKPLDNKTKVQRFFIHYLPNIYRLIYKICK